jgi:uncharacterized protein
MSRPVQVRKIELPPRMLGYRPYGMERCRNGSVKLKHEEFESFRLINYGMLSQDLAAQKMDVSRPTFTRIYNKALKTIAKAFAEGKCIEIEGGVFSTYGEWYRCKKCRKLVDGIENHIKCTGCNNYDNAELARIE